MSGAKTGSAFLIAILAAMVLPCAGIAQMHAQTQQTGTADRTGTPPSSADATANSSAANPAGTTSNTANPATGSGGASSWTSGKSSFGITARTPVGSSVGASGGSWVSGTASFGIKNQPGGIWRESGSGSNTAPTHSPAAKSSVPASIPGSGVQGPAIASSPGRARSAGILASRSPAGGHPVSGARFGAPSGSRSGGSKSVGSKQASLGAHSHAGKQNHASASHVSSARSSSSHAKTHVPSAFTPSGPSTMGGMHQPGAGREPIP